MRAQAKFFIVILLFYILSSLPCGIFSSAAAAVAPANKSKEIERQKEFAFFIDGFFAGVKKDWQIPGMVFVAVQNGQIAYIKGYGVSDIDSQLPATPEKTLFRVGQLSEVVTATALLQLVEKGRLSLDEDVNTYLRRWKLPKTFERPVTLRHLLTHTGGFDDKKLEICAPTSADERLYASKLQRNMPARYAPPGLFYCESSMGYSLAGSIIERYSRQGFNQAIKKHIFAPLSMANSTFSPSAEELKRLATGYSREGNPFGYSYRYDMPGMGMSTTASDMGLFMIAQLNSGRTGRGRILPPMYANSMLRRHFSPNPKIEGTGLAYYERNVNGLRTLQKKGDIPGYSSFLMLIPEKKFGVFFAANASNLNFRDDLAGAIIRRFFSSPPDAQKDAAPKISPGFSPSVAGHYRTNRISRNSAEKVMTLLGDQLKVTIDGEALLLKHTNDKTAPLERWEPCTGPNAEGTDLFRLIDENGVAQDKYLFFQRDAIGNVTALIKGDVGHTYDRLSHYESNLWQISFMALFVVFSIISAVGTMFSAAINRGKLPWEKGLRAATELWGISTMFCIIQYAFIIGMCVAVFYAGSDFTVFVPYQVKALFVIPLAGGLLLAWLWFRILANLFNPDHHWAEKLILIIVACVQTGYMVFLAEWRLLGFMF